MAVVCNIHDLTPTNESSLCLNDLVIKKVPGPSKEYISADNVIIDDETAAANYPMEFLNSITPNSNIPPHRLILKEGAIVMLLCNLDIKKAYAMAQDWSFVDYTIMYLMQKY